MHISSDMMRTDHHSGAVSVRNRLEGERLFVPFVLTSEVSKLVAKSPSGGVVFTPQPEHQPHKEQVQLRLEDASLYTTLPTLRVQMQLTAMGTNMTTMEWDINSSNNNSSQQVEDGLGELELYNEARLVLTERIPPRIVPYAKDVELEVTVRQSASAAVAAGEVQAEVSEASTDSGKEVSEGDDDRPALLGSDKSRSSKHLLRPQPKPSASRKAFKEKQRVGVYGAMWGPAVAGGSMQKDIDRQALLSALSRGERLFARIARTQKPHPLNPHLFNAHHRSLFQLLLHDVEERAGGGPIDWVNAMDVDRPYANDSVSTSSTSSTSSTNSTNSTNSSTSSSSSLPPDNDNKKRRALIAELVTDMGFAGGTSPMNYKKAVLNFFFLHIEQLAAASFNRCDSGEQVWLLVKRLEDLLPLLVELLQLSGDLPKPRPGDEAARITADEYALLPAMLLSRRLLLHPELLDKHNIEWSRHRQKAGDSMVLQGHVAHQGVVDNEYKHAHAEAVNYLDLRWLNSDDGGLRTVYEMCRWLREHYVRLWLARPEEVAVRRALRALLFDTYGPEGVCHFLPRLWSIHFFKLLRADLRRWRDHTLDKTRAAPPLIDYTAAHGGGLTWKRDGAMAVKRLTYCIDTLRSADVKRLYDEMQHTHEALVGQRDGGDGDGGGRRNKNKGKRKNASEGEEVDSVDRTTRAVDDEDDDEEVADEPWSTCIFRRATVDSDAAMAQKERGRQPLAQGGVAVADSASSTAESTVAGDDTPRKRQKRAAS